MLQLDNVVTTDNYDDCSIASESGSHVVYLIANNSARMQVRGLFDTSLGNTPDWTPPEGMLVAPTTAVIDKCSGIRFKSVVSGKGAQIIAQLMEPKDVLPQSGTPFTQQLSAAGVVGQPVQPYLPIWNSTANPQPSIGDGSLSGRYVVNGPLVYAEVFLIIGAATVLGGAGGFWNFSLPLPPNLGGAAALAVGHPGGIAYDFDTSEQAWVGWRRDGYALIPAVGPAHIATDVMTPAKPFAWAVNDQLILSQLYLSF